jgi:hypothetical protein
MKFRALQYFTCPELKSDYCRGFTYTVREADTLLAKFVPKWLSEGRIEMLDDASTGVSTVAGIGKVTDPPQPKGRIP